MGGSDKSYDAQTTVINKELAKPSQILISGSITFTGGISITISVKNIVSANINNVKLLAVIYEDLGTDEHHFVVRDILQPTAIASLLPGVAQNFTLKSIYSGSAAALNAVVYVQTSSGEILQAALVQK